MGSYFGAEQVQEAEGLKSLIVRTKNLTFLHMQVAEFRAKIKTNAKIMVDNQEYDVKEVVKFRFDDGSFYMKCFLSNDCVFADDLNENMFLLVKEVKTDIKEPFPERLDFQGRNFKFLYAAHAIAEEIQGEEIFKLGDSERFWDYKADDNSYLSLGINDQTGERLDFFGRIIDNKDIKLE
ncbi:hypothetical protein A3J77_00560 [Candidatus Wolfebacteria bacterium RBG_13_41_7]|uniref:Uncharacterized protein n=1 Tax=Candidatus Wolfebacteria bacterium RBG_13_41_7 TaxID=1802554 RepID=A0A1F8DMI1_9BACT|nr:MAG: hypothetical protein A3J77_00560 [Candidatus Wolfebacteria bacterium RBG_13_41_7]